MDAYEPDNFSCHDKDFSIDEFLHDELEVNVNVVDEQGEEVPDQVLNNAILDFSPENESPNVVQQPQLVCTDDIHRERALSFEGFKKKH